MCLVSTLKLRILPLLHHRNILNSDLFDKGKYCLDEVMQFA